MGYMLLYKCNNCFSDTPFKFDHGVTAPRYNAGECHHCGVTDNVVRPEVVSYTPSQLDEAAPGRPGLPKVTHIKGG